MESSLNDIIPNYNIVKVNLEKQKMSKKVKVKKSGDYLRVYHDGGVAATRNLKTGKTWCATSYFKHLDEYSAGKGFGKLMVGPRICLSGEEAEVVSEVLKDMIKDMEKKSYTVDDWADDVDLVKRGYGKALKDALQKLR